MMSQFRHSCVFNVKLLAFSILLYIVILMFSSEISYGNVLCFCS